MRAQVAVADAGSLGDLFHPHAIEVQDFSRYVLVVDARSQVEFDDDHIPGAIRISPDDVTVSGGVPAPSAGALALTAVTQVDLSPVVAALLAPLQRDPAILVYCGRGGRDSVPLAKALRRQGWRVDVLPGGWINYRR